MTREDRERIEVAKAEASTRYRHIDGVTLFIERCDAALSGDEGAQGYVMKFIEDHRDLPHTQQSTPAKGED